MSVSPDYFGTGWTTYTEATAQVSPAPHLQVSATVGVQVPLESSRYREQANGRLGIDWTSGRFSLHAAAIYRTGRDLYVINHSSRAAFLIGASYAL